MESTNIGGMDSSQITLPSIPLHEDNHPLEEAIISCGQPHQTNPVNNIIIIAEENIIIGMDEDNQSNPVNNIGMAEGWYDGVKQWYYGGKLFIPLLWCIDGFCPR